MKKTLFFSIFILVGLVFIILNKIDTTENENLYQEVKSLEECYRILSDTLMIGLKYDDYKSVEEIIQKYKKNIPCLTSKMFLRVYFDDCLVRYVIKSESKMFSGHYYELLKFKKCSKDIEDVVIGTVIEIEEINKDMVLVYSNQFLY